MAVAEQSAASASDNRHSDWPDVLAIRVWLLPEEDHWVAVAPDFDVVSQGRDEALALQSLEVMVLEYVHGCEDDGLSFAEAHRPIPRSERLRFNWRWLVSRPAAWAVDRSPAREGLFVPVPDGHAHVC